MKRIVGVTSGGAYLDVDAYAGCLAYAHLLCRTGRSAMPVSSARPNASVPHFLQTDGFGSLWPLGAACVLVDVSDPGYIDPLAAEAEVVEVIDHHPGWVEFWQNRPGVRVAIEAVGAAATLVWERWREAGLALPGHLGPLVAAAILDNTLNFRSAMTGDRDRQAYECLLYQGTVEPEFRDRYAEGCTAALLADPEACLQLDSKRLDIPGFPPLYAQVTLWTHALSLHGPLEAAMIEIGGKEEWILSLLDVVEGRTHFVCSSRQAAGQVAGLLGVKARDRVVRYPALVLRKEVLTMLYGLLRTKGVA